MNMLEQMRKDRDESADGAEEAIRSIVEEGQDMDGGQMWQTVMTYGRKLVEVNRIETACIALGYPLPHYTPK
jgi:hypothetical protein